MNRRKFLSWAVNGGGALAIGSAAIPSIISALSPALGEGPREEWRPVGPVGRFRAPGVEASEVTLSDDPGAGSVARRSVYVWRRSEADDEAAFVVYSRSCTDLGCPVTWDPGSEWFFCPCHGGIFDKEGERRAGPPDKPLWRYRVRVREGVLEIDLRSVPPMV